MNAPATSRMGSIDALRGLTVAAMLLVNNPGDWAHVYSPLLHADWHGITPTDLIFPLFLFIAGVSLAFSVGPRAQDVSARPALRAALLKRALRILVAGLLLHVLAWWLFALPAYRPWGVLQRIALCVGGVGLIAIHLQARAHAWVLAALLLGYSLILLGAGTLEPWHNPVSRLDTALFAPYLYKYNPVTGLGHDPEGLLSTLGALATTLLGLIAGRWLRAGRLGPLAVMGAGCLVLGVVAARVPGGLPLNKNLWTPSYVLVTGGLSVAGMLLAHLLVDRKGWPALGRRFGVNAIAAYLGSSVMALVMIASGAWAACNGWLVGLMPAHPSLASLLCASGFVLFWWGVVAWLDHRRIYVKI
ncbi:heparan-alpha-glucosaminide N-acetyltransferase domain-containing protein [Stenotrophomonas sp.]|uniref:acyltransferase family protein n=1 Tax=Stenotrophomonas sp. TaxID=69392 RepID=UPI0028AFBDCC|nr:heparan-alpha-glucosaminide N-acetyltransferase domain-containing protein [Stenotrophomonas sp.]